MQESEAKALRLRLELGLSVFNDRGEEIPVRTGQARPPRDQVPSVADLMARFADYNPATIPTWRLAEIASAAGNARGQVEASAERERQETAATVAAMMARLQSRAERRRSLPCYVLDPKAHPDAGGSDYEAALACEGVKAYRECEWTRDPQTCPRNRVDAGYEELCDRMRRAGVPAVYAERIKQATPGHREAGRRAAPIPMDSRSALRVAEAWLQGGGATVDPYKPFAERRPLLVLSGAMGGEGKSFAAAWVIAMRGGLWTSCAELAQIPSAQYDRAKYIEADTLVVDEVGVEPLTEWIRGRLFDLLAERIANNRRTVITTNIDNREGLVARYEERLARRIDESGRFIRLAPWQVAA